MAGRTYGGFRPLAGRPGWLAVLMAVIAAPAALLAAQPEVIPSAPARLNSPLLTTPRIEPVNPATPRIIPRPGNDAPSLESPPIGMERIAPSESGERQLQRELQRLQAQAEASRGPASTVQAAQAAWLLGLIYLHGAGVRIDPPLAQQWFERSAKQGHEPWAFAGVAWCALDGCTGPADPAAATRAIQRLRPTHPGRADFLAWLQATQRKPLQLATPGQTASTSVAIPERQLLERAAAVGDIPANIELGIIAFANKQLSQSEEYFRRVASRSVVAAHNLSVVQSHSRTMSAPVTPAPSGSAQAALSMARMYHQGQGVPANFSEAVRFYRLAEQRGSKEAHKMLELIFSRPMPDGSLNAAWMQQLANADTSTPALTLNSGVNALQMQREPTPLFDLLPPLWQQQVRSIEP